MRLIIVEDDPLVRNATLLLLEREPEIDLIGVYGSAEEALNALEGERLPEVMVVDLDLPGMSGIELTARVKSLHREIEILVFTVCEDRDTVFQAIKAGASGYLVKGCPPEELVASLQELHDGGAPMTPRIARRVLLEFRGEPDDTPDPLTAREREIVVKIREGLSCREIGDVLHISPHTVRTHVKKIYEKLHVSNRAQMLQQVARSHPA